MKLKTDEEILDLCYANPFRNASLATEVQDGK